MTGTVQSFRIPALDGWTDGRTDRVTEVLYQYRSAWRRTVTTESSSSKVTALIGP